jgi:hypothetical protein
VIRGTVPIVAPTTPDPSIQRLLDLCLQTMAVDGATVSLIDGSGEVLHHGSSEPYTTLGALQDEDGEGPATDALRRREPVVAAALGDPRTATRWPRFTPVATQQGVRGVFAFPLQAGATFLGVLTFYRRQPGELPGSVTLAPMLLEHAVGVGLNHLIGMPTRGPQDADAPSAGPRGAGDDVPAPRDGDRFRLAGGRHGPGTRPRR